MASVTVWILVGAECFELEEEAFFFFKQKTAYEMPKCLEFRRVLFRSPYSAIGNKTLKNRLLDSLSCNKNDHFVISTDAFSIIQPIDLSNTIYDLEKTFAYRFYLNRNSSQISTRYIPLNDTLCAWKFSYSIQGWHGVNSVNDMILCRKSDFLQDMKGVRFDTVYGLVNMLHQVNTHSMKVGLFFNQPKINPIY